MCRHRFVGVFLLLFLLALPTQSNAASGYVSSLVTRILATGNANYGGCMAKMAASPRTILSGCGNDWLSFSCTGDFNKKDQAYQMLDLAKMAFAMDKKLAFYFSDTRKHNGYCVATRVDILK